MPRDHVTQTTRTVCPKSKSVEADKSAGNESNVTYSHSVITSRTFRGHQQRGVVISDINTINKHDIPPEVGCTSCRCTALRGEYTCTEDEAVGELIRGQKTIVNIRRQRVDDRDHSRSSTPSPLREYTCTEDEDVGELINLFRSLTLHDEIDRQEHEQVLTIQPKPHPKIQPLSFISSTPCLRTPPLYTRLRLCCRIPRPVTMTSAGYTTRGSEKKKITEQRLPWLTGQQQRGLSGTLYRSSSSAGAETGKMAASRKTWQSIRDCGKMSGSQLKTQDASMNARRVPERILGGRCDSSKDRRDSSELTRSRTPCQLMTTLLRVSCRIPQPLYNQKHVIKSTNSPMSQGMIGSSTNNNNTRRQVNQVKTSDYVTKQHRIHNDAEGETRRILISPRTRFVTRGDQHKLSIDDVTDHVVLSKGKHRTLDRVTPRALISSNEVVGVITPNVHSTVYQSAIKSSSSVSELRSSINTNESHVTSDHVTSELNENTTDCMEHDEPQVLTIMNLEVPLHSTSQVPHVPQVLNSPRSTRHFTTFRRYIHPSEHSYNRLEALPVFAKFVPVGVRSSRCLEFTDDVTGRHGEYSKALTSRSSTEMKSESESESDVTNAILTSLACSFLGVTDCERRFHDQYLELYCETVASLSNNRSTPNSEHWVMLYTSGQCNEAIWSVQKELALVAMTSFFDPCHSVLCVRCDDRSLVKLIDAIVADDPDANWVIGGQVNTPAAALLVSPSAGQLVRHNRLQFLSALCLVLEIDKNRLVVLQTSMT